MQTETTNVPTATGSQLTDMQRLWLAEYLTCWNATEAARRAGYSPASVRVIGQENLHKPAIRAEIDAMLAERSMGAREVLARLTEQARGDVGEALTVKELENVTGRGKSRKVTRYKVVNVDLVAIKEAGLTYLVKKVKQGKYGSEVEFYDAQKALALLGRFHGLIKDTSAKGDDGDINDGLDEDVVTDEIIKSDYLRVEADLEDAMKGNIHA